MFILAVIVLTDHWDVKEQRVQGHRYHTREHKYFVPSLKKLTLRIKNCLLIRRRTCLFFWLITCIRDAFQFFEAFNPLETPLKSFPKSLQNSANCCSKVSWILSMFRVIIQPRILILKPGSTQYID